MDDAHNPEGRNPNQRIAAQSLAAGMHGQAQVEPDTGSSRSDERVPLFWRVFGGTVLSIGALVIITLWQQFSSSLQELRSDLNHLADDLHKDMTHVTDNEGSLVKKEDFNGRLASIWDHLKELRDMISNITALKERAAMLEQRLHDEQAERKELARQLHELREARAAELAHRETAGELQRLRERLAVLEGRHTSASSLSPAVHRAE